MDEEDEDRGDQRYENESDDCSCCDDCACAAVFERLGHFDLGRLGRRSASGGRRIGGAHLAGIIRMLSYSVQLLRNFVDQNQPAITKLL
jgi:hypothetical protein